MSDNVNKPSHYSAGNVETIDAIKSALGDAFLDYCRGNVLKYVWRCRHKGKMVEDLRKAAKYLEWAIAEAENDATEPTKPGHVEGVWVEEADANAKKIKPTETSDASIPDPGPGYRLLSKDPPERVVKGDEFLTDEGAWVESGNWHHGLQTPSYYYRRKIEPAEWIPKVGDKVRVAKERDAGRYGTICDIHAKGELFLFQSDDGRFQGWMLADKLQLVEAAQ